MALPNIIQPVPQFNFTVTMWDAPAQNDTGSILTSVASAAIDLVSQFFFGAFSEIQGLNADIEIETYQEGGQNTRPHRFFKHSKYQNLILKHGVTSSTAMWDWHEQVRTGVKKVRKNGMIILYDRGGPNLVGAGLPGLDRIPTAAWTFDNALPERVQGPTLNAKSNEIAIETLEMSHEQLQRLSLSMIPGFADINSALGGLAGAGAAGAMAGAAALA
jgi:phage tail-like protein